MADQTEEQLGHTYRIVPHKKNKGTQFTTVTNFVRFEVLTAASMMFTTVFWVVLPCQMIILHGSTSKKTVLNSNLTGKSYPATCHEGA
jgi:hypothetical protein